MREQMPGLTQEFNGLEEINDDEVQRILAMVEAEGTDVLTDDEAAVLQSVMPAAMGEAPDEHGVNLAEYVDDSELSSVAKQVVQWYEWDDESRADWKDREASGIKMLGVTEKTEGGASFDGASKVVHPLLMEACVQFQARAISELWPAGGPVKGVVLGDSTPELEAQKDRVSGYMNYQYTTEMPGAFETEDNLLFRLPLSGSTFTKVYRDPLTGKLVREFIDPNYFVVPYGASSLRNAPRYTHTYYESTNTIKKKQRIGFYRDVQLSQPYEDADAGSSTQTVRDTVDDADGRQQVNISEDQRHTMLEMHVELDLKGFEDKDEDGEPTGIALPYVVTVERGSYQVLSIYRNWREDDPTREKRIHFTHRRFLPGLGFYGYGFLHAIGGLARSATGALRALLDTASFNNMPSGFRSKDAKLPAGKISLGPGEWPEVESTAEELSKAFFRLPYEEPSMTLYHLLGSLDDLGRRFASTTESMVGEGTNNGPVGTTVALIEQGMKLFSSIHKRQHHALAEEFKIVAELNSEELPGGQAQYPYNVPGESRDVMLQDFDDRVDVIPVSDPNMVSSTQRIAQAQSVLQLASEAPDLYDRSEAHMRMLRALRIERPEELLPDKSTIRRRGPVEENVAMTMSQPVKAFLEQDHAAHMIVHTAWFSGLAPEMQQMSQGAYMAHQAEHTAQQYLLQIEQSIGAQLPGAEVFSAAYDDKQEAQEIPLQVENSIAVRVAQVAQAEMARAQQQQAAAENEAMMADDRRKDAVAAADQSRKDSIVARDQDRKDAVAAREQHRKDVEVATNRG